MVKYQGLLSYTLFPLLNSQMDWLRNMLVRSLQKIDISQVDKDGMSSIMLDDIVDCRKAMLRAILNDYLFVTTRRGVKRMSKRTIGSNQFV